MQRSKRFRCSSVVNSTTRASVKVIFALPILLGQNLRLGFARETVVEGERRCLSARNQSYAAARKSFIVAPPGNHGQNQRGGMIGVVINRVARFGPTASAPGIFAGV